MVVPFNKVKLDSLNRGFQAATLRSQALCFLIKLLGSGKLRNYKNSSFWLAFSDRISETLRVLKKNA